MSYLLEMASVGDHVKFKSANGAFILDGVITKIEGDDVWVKNESNITTKTRRTRFVPNSTPLGKVKSKNPGIQYIQRWASEDGNDDD